MKTITVRPDGKRMVLRRASSDEDLSSSFSPIFITAKPCLFDQIEKTNIEDEPRSGRPPTAVTQEKIELVRFLLREDRRITLTEDKNLGRVKWCNFMLKKFDKGKSKAVFNIGFTILIQKQNGNLLFGALQNHLLLRKFAKLEVLENKWSLVFFFRKNGFIDIVKLEDRKIDLKKIKQSRPRAQLRGVLLRHDNARPHTSAQTLDFYPTLASNYSLIRHIHQT
ncbi:hypothetical protein LAZ67_X001837 [Cordylochernes scorpioides]|uniref:Transposase n=1 Tax=Cordylochernes scorpioides TaxID=51811 RepID=A0ABY6LUY5_9ARAC|nr:hypothetical protein LAZ67_X001837 [Cordylochernes scorpioides]